MKIRKVLETVRQTIVQPFFRKMTGMEEYREEIEALYYIINKSIDITNFPKATGLLRQVQIADTEMLRIFHEICEKNQLVYWLDYGTLLGAIRHKGFIPWDDDLDVAMPRDDYNKIKKILPKEFKKYGIEVLDNGEERIGVLIWNAGMILDIYPMDKVSMESVADQADLKTRIQKYRKYYIKHKNTKTLEELKEAKKAIIGPSEGAKLYWYHNPEFCGDWTTFDNSDIFPLEKFNFEGYHFWVPRNYSAYLTELYGLDYVRFPHNGLLHHYGSSTSKIYENAARKGVDIDAIIENLKHATIS